MAAHLNNAAVMEGLLRSASSLTFASVKLPEATSASSADRAKLGRQVGNNVNRRKGSGFMAHSFGSEREFEVLPMRGQTSGVNADRSDQTNAEPLQRWSYRKSGRFPKGAKILYVAGKRIKKNGVFESDGEAIAEPRI
jgi:hypothetical protein